MSEPEQEDNNPFQEWLLRGISDQDLEFVPAFNGVTVPDREPTGTNPWLPIGPDNVGGRVRAFVADAELRAPGGTPRALYAGAASGGVFRSLDEGLSWHSIWPNGMPAAAIGALACGVLGGTRYLWVATGEKNKLTGNGVWRATLPAGTDPDPVVWDHLGSAAAMKGAGAAPNFLDAAAVDPDDGRICWFAGPTGAYRYDASGAPPWSAWRVPDRADRTGPGCADVKFLSTTHGRYVVLATLDSAWGDTFLIRRPDDPEAAIQAGLLAANVGAAQATTELASPLRPAGAAPAPPALRCTNARIAVVPDGAAAGDRVYILYATTRTSPSPAEPINAIVVGAVTDTAGVAEWSTRLTWAAPQTLAALDGSLTNEGQGTYTLALVATGTAGAPATDLLVVGLLNVAISTDSGATFTQSLDWNLYNDGLRGYHADLHALVFTPESAGRARLWAAQDGGISTTTDYLDAAGAVTSGERAGWRRRIAGLANSQTYDVMESRALPDTGGIALQDLGAWRSGGSSSWRYVLFADGANIALDPHDPYHYIAATQGFTPAPMIGCYDLRFEGLANASFFNGRILLHRGYQPSRTLARGLVDGDEGAFEDTVTHPTMPGRVLHIRKRRVYAMTDGETWQLQPIGDHLELLVRVVFPAAVLVAELSGVMVRVSGTAALKLGFMPGETSELSVPTAGAGAERVVIVRVLNALPDPEVGGGDVLTIAIELSAATAAPSRWTTSFDVDFPDASYHWKEIIDRIETRIPHAPRWTAPGAAAALALAPGLRVTIRALPVFAPSPTGIEVVTDATGPTIDLLVGGAAAAKSRVRPRSYRGDDDRPAVVSMPCTSATGTDPAPAAAARIAPTDHLTIAARRTPPPPPPVPPPPAPAPAPPAPLPPAPIPLGAAFDHELGPEFAADFFAGARPFAAVLEKARLEPHDRPAFRFWPASVTKWVRVRAGRSNAAAFTPMTVTGTAVGQLISPAPAAGQMFVDLKPPKKIARYDLATPPPPTVVTFSDGAALTIDVPFDPADFGAHLDGVTVEEVRRRIDQALNHRPGQPATDWAVEVQRQVDAGQAYEVAYSPANPDVMWVGALNQIWVSTDAGVHWRNVMGPPLADSGELRNFFYIEGIAPDPFPPSSPTNPVYTALVGSRGGSQAILRCSSAPGAMATPIEGPLLPAGYEGGGDPAQPVALRIYALEADPQRRNTYYAATEIGVFRTTDHGGSWSAFSTGLPHVPAFDLALDADTDTLRVAVFGRGIYERRLGHGAAELPTVYLRANSRDAGRRPVAHGPDLEGDVVRWVDAATSPDVKLSSRSAAELARLDVVELEELPSELVRAGDYRLVVRASNRGATPISDARVIAAWGPADAALTPLPAAFWDAVAAGTLASGDVHGGWTTIGVVAPVARIEPACGRLAVLPVTFTAAQLAGVERVALVAFVTRGTAKLEDGPSDLGRLVIHDARAAMRLVDTMPPDDGLVRLRAVNAATGLIAGPTFSHFVTRVGGVAPAPGGPQPQFPAIAPGPPLATVTSTNAAPFDTVDVRLDVTVLESFATPQATFLPSAPAIAAAVPVAARGFADGRPIHLDDAHFASPAAVSAPALRDYLAKRFARFNHLIEVVEPRRFGLALRRSPVDGSPHVGGASWLSGELVITAAGTVATDDDFAVLALARAATVPINARQTFNARVWNRSDEAVTAADTQVRFFWFDPHAETPTATPLGAAVGIAVLANGTAIASVEDLIPAVSADDVLVIAELDHPRDRPPAFAFPTWDAVRAWAIAGDNTLARALKRR